MAWRTSKNGINAVLTPIIFVDLDNGEKISISEEKKFDVILLLI